MPTIRELNRKITKEIIKLVFEVIKIVMGNVVLIILLQSIDKAVRTCAAILLVAEVVVIIILAVVFIVLAIVKKMGVGHAND